MNKPFSRNDDSSRPGSDYDARPIVAIRRQDRSAWWFAGGVVIAAALLFSALEVRRNGMEQADAQRAPATAYATPEAIPELVVPTVPGDAAGDVPSLIGWPKPSEARPSRGAQLPVPYSRAAAGDAGYAPQAYSTSNSYQPPLPPPASMNSEPIPAGPPLDEQLSSPRGPASSRLGRIMASRLESPATTVVQGTLINAVLETALDSTRPGQTRAIVTRNVYGFDGTRLLIPRGSRLYGVYESDVAQGQRRAQIRWTRLLRPDGVTVAMDSPAADPLGRAGVEGKVDNHFFQRLGNALVGTTASVGSALVTQSIAPSSPVVVAMPGATQATSQVVAPSANQIAPTLTVRQGTRITVFVRNDLDFSLVDEASE